VGSVTDDRWRIDFGGRFGDKRFDIILAQGFFEYAGGFQAQKFAEIARLLNENGTFIVSYVNFSHRHTRIYWPYNNVQAISDFRQACRTTSG
jgi:hypothetical protein